MTLQSKLIDLTLSLQNICVKVEDRRKERSLIKLLLKHIILLLIILLYMAMCTFIGCPFKYIFKIPCPTCGVTRSILALLRLDFKSSFCYNPMTIPLLVVTFLSIHIKLFKAKKLIIALTISVAVVNLVIFLFRIL